MNPEISIVIPAFNEARRLPDYLESWLELLPQKFRSFEIIIVDDGSTDDLFAVLAEHPAFGKVLRVLRQTNQGKGAAVKRGMLSARGHLRLFADADGATPAAEISALLNEYDESRAPIVIGSRLAKAGKTEIKRKWFRHYLGRIFTTLVSAVADLDVYDSQCGFKLFSARAAEKVFSHLEDPGWAFDIELLLWAKKFNFPIVEVAVNWRDVPGSKIKIFKDGLKMIVAVFRIKHRLAKF